MKLLFLTLVFFICFTAIGQNSTTSSVNSNYVITGKVYDSTIKQYLEGASILCRNKYGTSSGYDGKFRLKLPEKYSKKNFSIHVFSLGYNSAKIKIKNKIPVKVSSSQWFIKNCFATCFAFSIF